MSRRGAGERRSPGRDGRALATPAWATYARPIVACAIVAAIAIALGAALERVVAAAPPDAAPPPELVPPVLVTPVVLEYPADLAALPDPPEGTISVAFVVGTDGVPTEIRVERGVHPTLDELAALAVASLRYEPARYRDQPVEVAMRIEIAATAPRPRDASRDTGGPGDDGDDGEATTGSAFDDGEGQDGGTDPVRSGPLRLRGVVLVAGQRTPLSGATVVAYAPAAEGTDGSSQDELSRDVTDAMGRFALHGLPDGRVSIVVLAADFDRMVAKESLGAGEVVEVRYYARPSTLAHRYHTLVSSSREREEISRREISREEIAALPGGQGDALRSLQALPGVGRPAFGVGLLVIRGAAPFDSAIYFGEHQIPLLFHFGALATAVNSDALEGVHFVPSNYDARWGNAIGGVVAVTPRRGRRDGHHGYVDADLLDAGVLTEGPIGRGSYIASFRRSYIDAILAAASPDTGDLALTRLPRYLDYLVFFDHPVRGANLGFRVFGSDDKFAFSNAPPNDAVVDQRNRGGAAASIHRVDVVLTGRAGAWDLLASPSYRYEYGEGVTGPQYDFDVRRHAVQTRATARTRPSKNLDIEFGGETVTIANVIDAQAAPIAASPVPSADGLINPAPSVSDDQLVVDRSRGLTGNMAHWLTASIALGPRIRLLPGVRATWFIRPIQRWTVDPRVRFAADLSDTTQLRGGVGLYSQTPLFQELSPVFGNSALSPYRAVHTSLEIEQALPSEWSIVLAGYYNRMWDLATVSGESIVDESAPGGTRPERLASTGQGAAYGAEVMVRKRLTRALLGWASYSLTRSQRRIGPTAAWYDYDFDQRHNLSVVAAVALPHNWRLGLRFRLTSGVPYTPILGAVFDANTGDHLPIQGVRNSERFPTYHQLDLRVDKRWIMRRTSIMAYFDLQNAYNARNVELFLYSFDYRARQAVTGLPILPGFGLRLEW